MQLVIPERIEHPALQFNHLDSNIILFALLFLSLSQNNFGLNQFVIVAHVMLDRSISYIRLNSGISGI